MRPGHETVFESGETAISIRLIALGLALFVATGCIANCATAGPQESGSGWNDPSPVKAEMQTMLDGLVASGKMPAVFAAVGGAGMDPIVICSGHRRAGKNAEVTATDLVHIGSCTKAMTAALVGRLVDQGKLDWKDTIAMRLPELKDKIDPVWHDKTFVQLLSHTAGVPHDPVNWWGGKGETATEKRNDIIAFTLKNARTGEIPEWEYSNLGVMIAGQMAAESMDCSWEELITRELFQPLGMSTAGFGPPGDQKKTDQPWGHLLDEKKEFHPVYQDNAPALGPAGRVHLSMADWLKFTGIFYDSDQPGFLTDSTRSRLTRPIAQGYAMGWIVLNRPWGNGTVIYHNGSNTMWMAVCWISPKTGRSYLVVLNHAGDEAAELADQVVAKLISLERGYQSGKSGNR